MRFHGLALHCRRQVSWESGFAPRCAELRGFTAEISQTVEQTVKKGVLARAWNCSSALTELKGRARARFEGAALVAAFVAKHA